MSAIQMRNKGNLTLPVELRRKYQLKDGSVFTIIDIGDGTFLLTPQVPQVTAAADRVAQVMARNQMSLEELFEALDEERENFYREQYVKAP